MSKVDPVTSLAENVRRLMLSRGEAQLSLAKRAGVSQRVVGDLLTYGTSHFKNPTVRTVAAVASAYDLDPWVLMIPDMPISLLESGRLSALLKSYRDAGDQGRLSIDRIAAVESRHANLNQRLERTGTAN